MHTKIMIPKISDKYKLYVYTAKSADGINTISKIRTIKPLAIIDESVAQTEEYNGKQCYVINDSPSITQNTGITYIGPTMNPVPVSVYETEIEMAKVNNHTYANVLKIKELETKYIGTVIYYSVIGVDEESGNITHLSKVNQVLLECDYKNGSRKIMSCEDYQGKDTDIWKEVANASWDEEIEIGNINDIYKMKRFGIPFVEKVPVIDNKKINVDTRPIVDQSFAVLEIQNPWKQNNTDFNYRKLKSYKIQNITDEQYGDFSEPTYQSLLPVSIEKMLILRQTGEAPENNTVKIEDRNKEGIWSFEIVRNDGIYYNKDKHKRLGLNKYNISLNEPAAVFNEGSVQDKIRIQVESYSNFIYYYSIYLYDIYGNISEPCNFKIET